MSLSEKHIKTLKHYLKPYIFQEYDSDDNTDEAHQMFYIDDVLKAVEEWLTQKLQENPYNESAKTEQSMYSWTINHILKDLKL